jgi:Protein of unknown function (DUF2752)
LSRSENGLGSRAVPRPGTIVLDPTDVRYAAAAGVVAGVALPLLPVHLPLMCPLRAATGVPCPLCGMTTSVTETLRFDLEAALAVTPAGVAAVVAAIVLLAVRPRSVRVPAPLPYLVLGSMWLYQLHRFSFL